MKTFRIIFALLRVRRLFATLLLFPLLGSLTVVITQLILSGSALRQISEEKKISTTTKDEQEETDWQFLRLILFGNGLPQAKPLLCIWNQDPEKSNVERPPSKECAPDKLDIALHVSDDLQVDRNEYLRLIEGNALRLHICKTCKPELELFVSNQGNSVKAHSSYGLMLYGLLMLDRKIQEQFKALKIQRLDLKEKLGQVFFFLPELKAPIQVSSIQISMIFILNITALIVISLWLGLRAHRKVLDYFSKSGALLPMVAATGKTPFYLALWGITGLRVSIFLLASIPLMLIILDGSSEDQTTLDVFSHSLLDMLLWLLALLSSMTLATIIASISDLKGRHEILSALYKIIPLLLSALGAILWAASFLVTSEQAGIFRSLISTFPILGMGPMILAPVVQPKLYILIIHTIASSALIYYLMKKNAHWFAAHLEEL